MNTPVSSIVLVLVASLIGSLAMVLLKLGADRHRRKEPFSRWISAISGGIALFLVSSVLYVLGIKGGSLTILYPMVSTGYVWGLLWSRMFFGEPFNRHKVVGLSLVLAGVFFIGLGQG
jgi:drug/metabolite transporter (DMT)-like permease